MLTECSHSLVRRYSVLVGCQLENATKRFTFVPSSANIGSMELPSTEHKFQFEEQSIIKWFCQQICTLLSGPAVSYGHLPCFDNRAKMVVLQGNVLGARITLLRGGHDDARLGILMKVSNKLRFDKIQ